MKEFINKIKNMDKTKRIVILFITISFVFIGSFSIYNGVTGNYKTNQVAQVDTTKNKKEKNTKETKKEEKQEITDQTQETSESTQSDSQSSTQSTDETKTNDDQGNIYFNTLNFNQEGHYVYYIQEHVNDNDPFVEYDQSIYQVNIDVSRNGNNLQAEVEYLLDKQVIINQIIVHRVNNQLMEK